jgi:uncharacterized membrane protein
MTDEQTPTTPPAADEPTEPVFVAAAAVGDEEGILAEGAVAIQGTTALLVARFADPAAAGAAYESLRAAEDAGTIDIDGVLVVDADASGQINVRKLTDHHTRTGTLWGAVAGAALAIIFPPSLLAGLIGGGLIGGVIGKVANLSTKDDVAKSLAGVITPGTSGILAVVDLEEVEEVKAAIPEASEVKAVPVDQETADAITKAADEAHEEAHADEHEPEAAPTA